MKHRKMPIVKTKTMTKNRLLITILIDSDMKKLILMMAALLLIGSGDVFAQKKNVSKAKAKMNAETPDYVEAEKFIAPALEDSITKTLADTWFTAGKIYYKLFDAEQKKEWAKQKANQELMATSLMKAYDCFIVADSLDQMPNAKGKVPNKFRKQIIEISGVMQNGFINSGAYYFKLKDYPKAIKCFEYYLDYPNLKYWDSEKRDALRKDTMIPNIQYYCGASASQGNDSETAIKYFKMLLDVYQPVEEMYQFVIYEYGRLKDSVSLMEMYKIGAQKFPENPFYARSLINEYLMKNNLEEALIWINKAMQEGDSTNAVFWNLKAQILEKENDFAEAEKCFLKAIQYDPNFVDALGNVGRIYYNAAVEELDRVNAIKDDKKYKAAKAKMKSVFMKPLPYMEKAHELNPDERDYIVALRGIYYNLGKGYEKKYEEMDKKMKAAK